MSFASWMITGIFLFGLFSLLEVVGKYTRVFICYLKSKFKKKEGTS